MGLPIGPSRGDGGVQAKLTARQGGITAAAGTRAKAAGSIMYQQLRFNCHKPT